MTQILSNISSPNSIFLAQAQITQWIDSNLGSAVLGVIKAIFILVVGLIVAGVVKSVIKKLLNSTEIDNRIAEAITGQRGENAIPIEDWIASLFYWLIVLFAVVAFLNALELEAVSTPLNALLSQVTSFLPKILGAGFLLGIAWVVATLVKTIVTRALNAFNLDRRLGEQSEETSDFSLSDTIGNALYWFIFLLFLPSVLNTLQLSGTLEPVQALLNDILAMLPNILGAIIIGAVFWFVANIVRRIVTNLLAATGVDRLGQKFGISSTTSRQSLSSILGTVVFILILIPGAIAALERLQISAISVPAVNMLNQVLELLPKIFAAGVVLAFFYIAGQFVSELVTNILTSVGFNNLLQWLGISTTTAVPTSGEPVELDTEQPTVIQTGKTGAKTPSELVGLVALIAIILVGTLSAVNILGIPALEDVIRVILAIAAQVLIGLIIFAIGLYLANIAYNLIVSSGTAQSRFLGQSARVAILILVGAMALDRMGIAPNIVNLAFGLLLGGIAVAIALAFGLGGREVAQEELRSWVNSFKNK
ncbi:MAG: mechanosensitive ion channel [Pleurocapsa sp.]